MEQYHVYPLPIDNWKAVRTINFQIYGVPCVLQYYRVADISKLCQTPILDANNNPIQRRLELPIDELDTTMLEWVKYLDPSAKYSTRLLICNTDEPNARRILENIPEVNAEFISNPDFSGLTQTELFHLDGKQFTQFCVDVPIHIFGQLPFPKIRPMAIRPYPWNAQEAEAALIVRIRKEISY